MNEKDLRPYQIEDINFLTRLNAGACFNEQRTGKTPIAIRACANRGCTKVLIVCPTSVVYQWVDEYTRWCGDPCLAAAGNAEKRKHAIDRWTHGLVISYDNLRGTCGEYGRTVDLLHRAGYQGLVLDEAHRIRNHRSLTAKAAFVAGQSAEYRLALTGTPTPNHGYEIWAILHFLYPKTFRGYWAFINSYFGVSIERGRGRSFYKIGEATSFGRQQIHSALEQIATNRKRKDIMQWLPDKETIHVSLDATPAQRKYLDELTKFWETETVVTQGVLDRLIRYRQICLDPKILGLKGTSPKTDWIIQYLEDYPERPILIFSKFTSYLKELHNLLNSKGWDNDIIIGETPTHVRRAHCYKFQSGNSTVMLLNIDAGKEGLTLDRAEAIIFTDRFPPVGDLLQAEDRFVATTEARAEKEHLVYYLELKHTYDELVSQMITDRLSETDVINNFQHYIKERRHT